MALSNANRTVTWSIDGFNTNSVRGFIGKSSGKWYWELLIDDSSYVQVGLSNYDYFDYSGTGGQTPNYLQENANAIGAGYGTTDGNLVYNSSTQTTQPAFANGDVLEFALDANAKLFWYRKAGGNWNGNASYDPATGVGGVSVSGLGTGKLYPAVQIFADFGENGQITSRFASAQQSGSPPSGFSSLG